MSHRCPYCHVGRPTRAGVNHHIFKSPACSEKWRESLGIVVTVSREESEPLENRPDEDEPEEPQGGVGTPLRAQSPAFSSRVVPDEENDEDEDTDNFVPPRPASPVPEPVTQSRRATAEEVLDEDDPQNFRRFTTVQDSGCRPQDKDVLRQRSKDLRSASQDKDLETYMVHFSTSTATETGFCLAQAAACILWFVYSSNELKLSGTQPTQEGCTHQSS
ncbi:hypothetical protein B0H14DRAFT_3696710 [Mycena olivaceomarginata]|nr:hypothetical protein B0H14DRAFT_3696710 [Mycena olivaceomarginata]